MTVQPLPAEFRDRRLRPSNRAPITVALVNNMPDAALRATERQFRYLVGRGLRATDLEFQVYYIPEVPRGDAGERHCRAHYRPIDDLLRDRADALIVTGCEPRAAALRDEPFWRAFTAVVDWARSNTRSALWSCLAAHAAVLHLDGIERHRLPGKLSGIFACDKVCDHTLLAALPETVSVPHSRYNTLAEGELLAHGYQILMRSDRVGADSFTKSLPSLFLFLQGHPEYEGDSLGREYRRDLDRFFAGISAKPPALPEGYYDPATAGQLAAQAAHREAGAAPSKNELAVLRGLMASTPKAEWRGSAVQMYRNWLSQVANPMPTISREPS